MRVIIPGGSGHLGHLLADAFREQGDEVAIVTRHAVPARWPMVEWKDIVSAVDGADAVINLAGRSVLCRYRDGNRREILDSRIDTTRAVAEAIAIAKRPPRVWLQASTATIYDHRYDAANNERDDRIDGNDKRPE